MGKLVKVFKISEGLRICQCVTVIHRSTVDHLAYRELHDLAAQGPRDL